MTGAVAIIPARGGSKRLPRKNILPFAGKPMMAWTIEAAAGCGLFERIVVTTEDAEYAAATRDAGADVLDRPASLAADGTGLIDVVKHAISELDLIGDICLLLPNCPLRRASEIREIHARFVATHAPAMLSLVDYGWTPPQRALIDQVDGLHFVSEAAKFQKSQAYTPCKCPSGAVLWARSEAMLQSDSLYVPGIRGHEIPWHRGIDIDEPYDMELALCIHRGLEAGFRFMGESPAAAWSQA
jgi:pseudaminic acid cytidylyltransferase